MVRDMPVAADRDEVDPCVLSIVDDLVATVKAVLSAVSWTSFLPEDIDKLYFQQEGERVPFARHGFNNIKDFLCFGDPAAFSCHGNFITYNRDANHKTSHITKMVDQQKGASGSGYQQFRPVSNAGSQIRTRMAYIVGEPFREVLRRIIIAHARGGITFEEFHYFFEEQRTGNVKPFHTCSIDEYVYFKEMPDVCEVRGTPDDWRIYPAQDPLNSSSPAESSFPTVEKFKEPPLAPSVAPKAPYRRISPEELIKSLLNTNVTLAGGTVYLLDYMKCLEDNYGPNFVRYLKEFNGHSNKRIMSFIINQGVSPYTVTHVENLQLKIDRPAKVGTPSKQIVADLFEALKCAPYSTAFKTHPLRPSLDAIEVEFSDFIEPEKCFIITVEDYNKRKTLMTELGTSILSQKATSRPSAYEGMPCAVTFEQPDDYHRAVVREIKKQKHTAIIYYVDFGTEDEKSLDDILPLQPKYLEEPVFAHPCQISGMESLDGAIKYTSDVLANMRSLVYGTLFSTVIRQYNQQNSRYVIYVETLLNMFIEKGLARSSQRYPCSSFSNPHEEKISKKSNGNGTKSQSFRREFVQIKMLPNGDSIWLVDTPEGLYVPTGCVAAIVNMKKDLVMMELEKCKFAIVNAMELIEGVSFHNGIRSQLKDSMCPLIEDENGNLFPKICLVPAVCVPNLVKILPGDLLAPRSVCDYIQHLIDE